MNGNTSLGGLQLINATNDIYFLNSFIDNVENVKQARETFNRILGIGRGYLVFRACNCQLTNFQA